jgi:hypothetical protein
MISIVSIYRTGLFVGLAGTGDWTKATCVASSVDNRCSAIHYDTHTSKLHSIAANGLLRIQNAIKCNWALMCPSLQWELIRGRNTVKARRSNWTVTVGRLSQYIWCLLRNRKKVGSDLSPNPNAKTEQNREKQNWPSVSFSHWALAPSATIYVSRTLQHGGGFENVK